jgi:hypothetical protein
LPYVDTFGELGLSHLNTGVLQPIDGLHFGVDGYSRLGTFIGSKIKSLMSYCIEDYAGGGGETPEPVVKYTITYKYVDTNGNTVKANTAEQVAEGSKKTFTINNAPTVEGYTISSVNPTNATITGNITVVYTYTKTTDIPTTNYSISWSGSNYSSDNSSTIIAEGNTYTATITTDIGYSISSVNVTMGGSVISNAYNNGVITIGNVIGDIAIEVLTETVDKTLIDFSNVDKTNISITTGGAENQYTGWLTYNSVDCSAYSALIFVDVPCFDHNGICIYGISFYNENNEFISGVGTQEASETKYLHVNQLAQTGYIITGTCAIPDNAKYIRVSYADNGVIGNMVEYTTEIYSL